jgi:hypothetical protein
MWNKISLFKFQQIDLISKREISDLDKTLFTVCIAFDITEFQLDNLPLKKAARFINKVERIFKSKLNAKALKKIGKFLINYDPSKLTFGQYIDLAFFLQQPTQNCHYSLASIVSKEAETHKQRAEYFQTLPITKVWGSYSQFLNQFESFNKEYKSLFGIDEEVSGEGAKVNQFNKRYGWIYAAEKVAEYERISVEQTLDLPIRQALNDLAYLKAKGKYESELLKKKHG